MYLVLPAFYSALCKADMKKRLPQAHGKDFVCKVNGLSTILQEHAYQSMTPCDMLLTGQLTSMPHTFGRPAVAGAMQ